MRNKRKLLKRKVHGYLISIIISFVIISQFGCRHVQHVQIEEEENYTPPSVFMFIAYHNKGNTESISVGQTGKIQTITADSGSIFVIYSGVDQEGIKSVSLQGSIEIQSKTNQIQHESFTFSPIESSNYSKPYLYGVEDLSDYTQGKLIINATALNSSSIESHTDTIVINYQ